MINSNQNISLTEKYNNLSKADKYKLLENFIDDNFSIALDLISDAIKEERDYDYYFKVKQKSKLNFLKNHKEFLKNITESNGTSVFKKYDKKIGIIADEFLYNSFKDICDLKYISRTNKKIDKEIDFLLVVSTWNGIDNSWKSVASISSTARIELIELINEYKENNIPVVFYSKEDPVNFHLFKDIAKACDVIFTSAEEIIPEYIEYCGNERVYTLQFGVNPHYHNPVGTRKPEFVEKNDEVIFAGSWMEKYPVRNSNLKRILNGVIESGHDLTIIDRNLKLKIPRYQFPKEYIPYLTSPVKHNTLMSLHKIYRWAINVNSVQHSNTMFANRVFELQAFGNLLLSNFSVGVNNQFPNVFISNVPNDPDLILNSYTENMISDFRAKSIRNVMRNNTTYHRLDQIIEILGRKPVQKTPEILILAEDITNTIKENVNRQLNVNVTLKSFKEKIDFTKYDFVTYMNTDFIYEEYYIEDLLSAFKYVDVEFVTKDNNKVPHEYTNQYVDMYKTMFKADHIDETNLPKEVKSGYCIDESEIFKGVFKEVSQPELSVIVPIYNNGEYLEEKCFKSLVRSTIFEKMEILFVDDGSTDVNTKNIINRLRRRYPNIKHFAFESGSGSASRPRNKGVEMASTKYITYLDPDNEATGDGFKKLFEVMEQNPELDVSIGNIIKEDTKGRGILRYYATARKFNDNKDYISDTKAFLKRSGLRAQSIQAMIIKKDVIKNNNIRMVEGAAGQDTLFFQEVMLAAKNAMVVDEFIHVYYAAVTGSVTNSVSKTLFDKYMILEKIRLPFLIENGLLETYMNERFNFYFKYWYMPRLNKVVEEEREEAIRQFLSIHSMYDEYSRPADKELENTIKSLKVEINATN